MIDKTVHIGAPPEVVWRYFTDPDRMLRWLGPADLDPRAGGHLRTRLADGPLVEGEYVELTPYERLVFTFGWAHTPGVPDLPPGSSRVEVTLERTEAGTTLRLRHTHLPPELEDRTDSGWAGFLDALARAAGARSAARSAARSPVPVNGLVVEPVEPDPLALLWRVDDPPAADVQPDVVDVARSRRPGRRA